MKQTISLKVAAHAPLFTHTEACAAAGVDPRRATNWHTRGQTSFGFQVSEKKRLLTMWEACELALIGRLTPFFPIENAAIWAKEIMTWFRDVGPVTEANTLEDLDKISVGGRALFACIHPTHADNIPISMIRADELAAVLVRSETVEFNRLFLPVPIAALVVGTLKRMMLTCMHRLHETAES